MHQTFMHPAPLPIETPGEETFLPLNQALRLNKSISERISAHSFSLFLVLLDPAHSFWVELLLAVFVCGRALLIN